MKTYNKFADDNKWELVNKESKSILNDFIVEMKMKKRAEKTIYQYTNDIKIFLYIIYDLLDNISVLEISKKQWKMIIMLFIDERGMSSSRVNRLVSAMRTMLEMCTEDEDEYDYKINMMQKIKSLPKNTVREIIFLQDEWINAIEEELVAKKEWQKLAFLFLAYDSGARKQEIYQITKESVSDENVSLTNKVIGKRKKVFQLIMFSKSKKYIKKFLEYRNSLGEDDIESLWIRIDANGKKTPLSVEAFYYWVKEFNIILKNKLGIDVNASVHDLRHSSVDNMSYQNPTHYALKEIGRPNGLLLEELQLHLNHSSSEITKSYLQNRDEEIKLSMYGLLDNNDNEEKGE